MDNSREFKLSLDFEGQHYEGVIMPSAEKGANGMPIYFRVVLADKLFAYLCFGDDGWMDMEMSGTPKGLIDEIGNYILEYYE